MTNDEFIQQPCDNKVETTTNKVDRVLRLLSTGNNDRFQASSLLRSRQIETDELFDPERLKGLDKGNITDAYPISLKKGNVIDDSPILSRKEESSTFTTTRTVEGNPSMDQNDFLRHYLDKSAQEMAELRQIMRETQTSSDAKATQLRLEMKEDIKASIDEIKGLIKDQGSKIDDLNGKIDGKIAKLETTTRNEYKSLRRWIIGIVVPSVLAVIALVYMTWQIILELNK